MFSNRKASPCAGVRARSHAVFLSARSHVLIAPLPEVALRRFNLKLCGTLPEAADVTGRLATALRREVEQDAGLLKLYDEIDLPLVPVLARMEQAGVKIDRRALAEMSSRLEREVDAKAHDIYEHAGVEFNINSPKQLGDVALQQAESAQAGEVRQRAKRYPPPSMCSKDWPRTHEVPRLVLEYRQLSKLKSTYVDALPALLNPRQRPPAHDFRSDRNRHRPPLVGQSEPAEHSHSHRTGPRNSRRLHRRTRSCVARGGLFADRTAPAGALLERPAAGRSLPPRRRHSHPHRLAGLRCAAADGHPRSPPPGQGRQLRHRLRTLRLRTLAESRHRTREAKQFIDAYFEKYRGVRAFIDRTLEEARRDGKVKTLFGRVRPIPDINSKNANLRGFAERTAVNTPLQGTAADLIKIAMIRIDAALRDRGLKSRMTLQVHDELVFEVPEAEIEAMRTLVREHMEKVHPLAVPLLVEVGVGQELAGSGIIKPVSQVNESVET